MSFKQGGDPYKKLKVGQHKPKPVKEWISTGASIKPDGSIRILAPDQNTSMMMTGRSTYIRKRMESDTKCIINKYLTELNKAQ